MAGLLPSSGGGGGFKMLSSFSSWKFFCPAQASISVPSTAKCSSDSNRFRRAWRNTTRKNSSAILPSSNRSRFSVNTVGCHTSSSIDSPTNQRYSRLYCICSISIRSLRIEYSICSSNARNSCSGGIDFRPSSSCSEWNRPSSAFNASSTMARMGRSGWSCGTLSSNATYPNSWYCVWSFPRIWRRRLLHEHRNIGLAHAAVYVQDHSVRARRKIDGQLHVELVHAIQQPRRRSGVEHRSVFAIHGRRIGRRDRRQRVARHVTRGSYRRERAAAGSEDLHHRARSRRVRRGVNRIVLVQDGAWSASTRIGGKDLHIGRRERDSEIG